ncbi:hypothetical protein GOP47_0001578 [Adiantum capillus-veneris]|uniref:Rrn7/TAF1B N-terminal cyclin domain-containing protein n=1 Tax=Adiantum capillus-veneris TaxID=13818 RepID=A0A9D4ZQU3_ADICA|nr:hypothetical protein GOP47_0001578 [Adiantum capillus-veneris]
MSLFGLCNICGGNDLQGGEDGYFYCSACGSQSQQFQEQLLDYEAMAGYTKRTQRSVAAPEEGAGGIATARDDPNPHLPSSQAPFFSHVGFTDSSKPWETPSATWVSSDTPAPQPPQPVDPMEIVDADAAAIRSLYIEGFQHIIQLQCETLVQKFQVSPLICGIFGPVWLRFISFTRVLEKDWGKEAIQVEEARNEKRKGRSNENKEEASDEEEVLDDRVDAVQMRMALRFIWLNALKERIPLAASLAIIYLACHIADEAILTTDLVQWASKGSLPYLAAFSEVEKKRYGLAWPIEARLMFKPVDVVGARKLEFMAASIARRIKLHLPPVNFDATSCRFLKELNLPVERLSTFVHRIYDWYRPPGLHLSDEPYALPTRVYVMAMVMITLKILYKVDGQLYRDTHEGGCGKRIGSPSDREKHDHQATLKKNQTTEKDTPQACDSGDWHVDDNMETFMGKATQSSCYRQSEAPDERDDKWNAHVLLEKLEKSWKDHATEPFDYEKDLDSYLKYCKDFIFSGLKLEGEEENMCERLWRLYEHPPEKEDGVSQKKPSIQDIPEVQSLSEDSHFSFASFNVAGSQKEGADTVSDPHDSKAEKSHGKIPDDMTCCKKNAEICSGFLSLEKLACHMESLGFQCLPPRKQPLVAGKYLRYVRKKAKGGNSLQLVHADYFMVLCACAHVIRVHPVALHWCVQRIEKSLLAIEEKAKDFSNMES